MAWLVVGAVWLTTAFSQTTPVASAAVLGWVVGERLLVTAVGWATEYRADAFAARRTSPAAVTGLLTRLRTGSAERARGQLVGLPSMHPPEDRRIARLHGAGTREQDDARERPGRRGH